MTTQTNSLFKREASTFKEGSAFKSVGNNSFEFKGTNDNYASVQRIGSGAYGAVFKVVSEKGGKNFALKVFLDFRNKLNVNEENLNKLTGKKYSDFEVEYNFSKLLEDNGQCSPYVTCSYDTGVINAKDVYALLAQEQRLKILPVWSKFNKSKGKYPDLHFLVQELMDGDITDMKMKDVKEIRQLMFQTLKGIQWIHSKGIAHNDVKEGNIFFSLTEGEREGLIFKIGDLGGSCAPMTSMEIGCRGYGTAMYVSPTIMQNFWKPITITVAQSGDMWSLGILYYMFMKDLEIRTLNNRTENDFRKLFPFTFSNFQDDFINITKGIQTNRKKIEQKDIYEANFSFAPNLERINDVINGLLSVDDVERLIPEEALSLLSSSY